MNRSSKRMTKKQAEQKAHRMMSTVYVLIAVVAIIECLLLVTFATFSWIESNSSLIIQNGPESTQTDVHKKLNIANELNYKINLNTAEGQNFRNLKDFFSEVKYFEFSKTTTADGKTFFFPYRNNTYQNSNLYRKGDTDDYNTSYLYFDFVMDNRNRTGYTAENQDVYFECEDSFDQIFTVSQGDFAPYDPEDPDSVDYVSALRSAMRMSITTQVGNTVNTKIYSYDEYSSTSENGTYNSIPEETSNATESNLTEAVTTHRIQDYVFSYNPTNNAVTSKKLFVAKKNYETKVSVRVWFEWRDPKFQSVFIGSNTTSYFDSSAYKMIPSAKIGLKFAFKVNANDLRTLCFDDYTFSKAANAEHLTDENQNYSVWFYAYQPEVAASSDHPARSAGYFAVELEPDRSYTGFTRWSTSTADSDNPVTASMMEYLMGINNHSGPVAAASRYTKSYFCYGDFSTKTAVYQWALPAAPATDNDFIFNAYSYQPNSSVNKTSHSWTSNSSGTTWWDCNGTGVKLGVGQWQNDDVYTTVSLLKFRDMSTSVTQVDYNQPGTAMSNGQTVVSTPNFQHMNFAAEAVGSTANKYLVYVNNLNNGTMGDNYGSTSVSQTVVIDNASSPKVQTTISSTAVGISAAMYYDATEKVFKSYVPTYWLTGDNAGNNGGVAFSYSPSGELLYNKTTLRWYSAKNSIEQIGRAYRYTALGYSGSALSGVGYVPEYYSAGDGLFPGVGTWKDVEQIKFSTELIDSYLSASYRYYVGIPSTGSVGYYVMIPDETNMTFSAYVPAEISSVSPEVSFARYDVVKSSESTNEQKNAVPSAYWSANTRGTYGTYYPVSIVSTAASSDYTRGYWNLSVLVDGTYENLIYDTLTDGTAGASCDPTHTADPNDSDNDIIDFSPRSNYGKLEFSVDYGINWTTVIDQENSEVYADSDYVIDRYRFFAPAEGYHEVIWRWTPYTSYSSFTAKVNGENVTFDAGTATVFTYEHDVYDASSTGIYKLVIEALDDVNYSN